MEINEKIPFISTINLIGGFTVFPLKAYFDIFAGAIQAYIFSVLTLVY
ncbi:hypothetical protein FACS189459_5120 [Bacilli bacterium]|nr:hypothetical protein FACS189459_5120 [Bacilli bacterium]